LGEILIQNDQSWVMSFNDLQGGRNFANGKPVGIQIMFWDVTNRKQAEVALGYERYLLHSLLDNVPDSIYFKDESSGFLLVSNALAQRFGLDDPHDALGKSDFDFFTAEHAKQAREDELKLMSSDKIPEELMAVRAKIDEIDRKLIALLGERFNLTHQVGILKASQALAAVDSERESQKLEELRAHCAEHGLDPDLITELFTRIMQEVVRNHHRLRQQQEA